jgi:SAM-dependent methyltransferase
MERSNRKQRNTSVNYGARLLDAVALERSEIVANARMNRERNLSGANSYEKDLGLAPVDFLKKVLVKQGKASWLDLCCGAGRALIQAAEELHSTGLGSRVALAGVDLIPMFDPIPVGLNPPQLHSGSVERWTTVERFDLITCVHGLHYVGDKLGVLERASTWLKEDGLLIMHLDYRNLRVAGKRTATAQIGRDLHRAGYSYVSGRHLFVRSGSVFECLLPYRYLGADDKAGPNHTGQAAVDSYYERVRV